MTFAPDGSLDPHYLITRARELVRVGQCSCLFSGLTLVRNEIELEQRTKLFAALAEAYDMACGAMEARNKAVDEALGITP